VLEKGRIIEQGSHHELLDRKGLYYAMWRQQIGERKPAIRLRSDEALRPAETLPLPDII
jgi:ATP-binding cassette subfamily B protein